MEMKKGILFGSILIVFLFMILPSVSAVKGAVESRSNYEIRSIILEELKEITDDDNPQPTCILLLRLIFRYSIFGIILFIILGKLKGNNSAI